MIARFNLFILLVLAITLMSACKKDSNNDEPGDKIDVPEGYTMIWSDEFNDQAINASKWVYETGDGTDYGLPAGWGNNELQIYTTSPDNSGIEKLDDVSSLYIKAMGNDTDGYTSAKLTTKSVFSMRFGRVDVKAKMPTGQGLWAAIWMLGDNIDEIDWPGCGEIDIAEVLGNEPGKSYSTLHYTDSEHSHGEIQDNYTLSSSSFNNDYHVFTLEWTPENIKFRVDGNEVHTIPIEDDMKEFLRSFYLVMNVAVGGYWPGVPDNTTTFPQTMYIDYVRVYEKTGFNAPAAPALDIEEETIGQVIPPSLAGHAFKDGFADLSNALVLVWGGGGEPAVSASAIAVDGDSSLVFNFPGGSWGGGYIELETPFDLSSYTHMKFSLNKPTEIVNGEIKLESPSTNAVIFLADYTATDVADGFVEYTIPLSDFVGLDLTEVTIPMALWNPQDIDQNFVPAIILIDNVHFGN